MGCKNLIGGYDLKTGQEIWRMSGGSDIPVPAPVVGDGVIYFRTQREIIAVSE